MTSSPPRVLSVDDFHALPAPERHVVLIDLAYRFCLRRAPEPDTLAARAAGLDDGIPFADMLIEIATSQEALANAAGTDLARGCSDGEFMTIVGRLLNGRGLVPAEIAAGQRFLAGEAALRSVYVKNFLNDYVAAKRDPAPPRPAHDAGRCRILGITVKRPTTLGRISRGFRIRVDRCKGRWAAGSSPPSWLRSYRAAARGAGWTARKRSSRRRAGGRQQRAEFY